MTTMVWPGERRVVVPAVEGALLRPESESVEELRSELAMLAKAHRRLRTLEAPQERTNGHGEVSVD